MNKSGKFEVDMYLSISWWNFVPPTHIYTHPTHCYTPHCCKIHTAMNTALTEVTTSLSVMHRVLTDIHCSLDGGEHSFGQWYALLKPPPVDFETHLSIPKFWIVALIAKFTNFK